MVEQDSMTYVKIFQKLIAWYIKNIQYMYNYFIKINLHLIMLYHCRNLKKNSRVLIYVEKSHRIHYVHVTNMTLAGS